ncbi:MAG: flagellar basal body-associated protein FliL [Oxalobacteraceae bacterium]
MAKAAPKEDTKADPVEGKSKKKLFLIIAIAVITLGVGGTAGALYLSKKNASSKNAAVHTPAKPPVFINLESFTVNLKSEFGDQYLQVGMTLQVPDNEQVDIIKLHMPQVRSRILMLLSSKTASEIASTEGKKQLSSEIIALTKQPFSLQGKPQSVSSVFFTSFIIQ